nr:MAG TPA: hypothetical protein [Caudoviricetes sp.]
MQLLFYVIYSNLPPLQKTIEQILSDIDNHS